MKLVKWAEFVTELVEFWDAIGRGPLKNVGNSDAGLTKEVQSLFDVGPNCLPGIFVYPRPWTLDLEP